MQYVSTKLLCWSSFFTALRDFGGKRFIGTIVIIIIIQYILVNCEFITSSSECTSIHYEIVPLCRKTMFLFLEKSGKCL